MAKLHYMPFYGLDFYDDQPVKLMTRFERDVYMELLWCQWREGSVPADVADLKRLVRDKVSDRVASCFPVDPEDGKRRNRKLEEIRKHHNEVSAARSKVGKLGAKTKQLLKQKASKQQAIATANGSAKRKQLESELEKDVAERRSGVRTTWLTPYAEAWRAQYDGEPNPGKLAKHLKGPRDAIGDEALLPRWRRYLVHTDAQYASPSRFAETHGKYARDEVRVLTDENGVERPHRLAASGEWEAVPA